MRVSNRLWIYLAAVAAALALSTAAAPLRAAGIADVPQIMVAGQGEANLVPDMALLSLTVTREAKTAREALDDNSAAMAKVLAAMRARGIADKDLQTVNLAIQPRYSRPVRAAGSEPAQAEITGYIVRHTLNLRVTDLDALGGIIDQSVDLGVNEGGSIQFGNVDPSPAIARARESAVKDAMARGRELAAAAGVSTGKILSISEQSWEPRPMPMMRASMAMEDAVPVAAGENSYRVTVQVTLAIDQ